MELRANCLVIGKRESTPLQALLSIREVPMESKKKAGRKGNSTDIYTPRSTTHRQQLAVERVSVISKLCESTVVHCVSGIEALTGCDARTRGFWGFLCCFACFCVARRVACGGERGFLAVSPAAFSWDQRICAERGTTGVWAKYLTLSRLLIKIEYVAAAFEGGHQSGENCPVRYLKTSPRAGPAVSGRPKRC